MSGVSVPRGFIWGLPCFKEVKIFRIFQFPLNSSHKVLHRRVWEENPTNLIDTCIYRKYIFLYFFLITIILSTPLHFDATVLVPSWFAHISLPGGTTSYLNSFPNGGKSDT